MDKIDKKILVELQKNGRISLTDLADKAGISLSPCQRRLKQLEQDGIIDNYQAHLNAHLMGFDFSAVIFISLKNSDAESLIEFDKVIFDIPEIVKAQRLFGDIDYLLHVVTKDLNAFQKVYDEKLAYLPNVARLSSTLVMKDIISQRGLPL